jgi:hypothetical protein
MSAQANPTPNPVSSQDAEVLVGILAILQGQLIGGLLDDEVTEKLATRMVRAGVLKRESDGSLPSAGRVGVALEDLNHRVRHALGETHAVPPSAAEAVMHVMLFPTEEQAVGAGAEVQGSLRPPQVEAVPDRGPDLLEPETGREQGWYLSVVCPELPPDTAFRERERSLEEIARRFGGTYTGFQGAPR